MKDGTTKYGNRWSPEDIAYLRKAWAEGESMKAIAHHLGVTEYCVKKKRGTMRDLPPRRGARKPDKLVHCSMYLEAPIHRAGSMRAFSRRQTFTAYVKMLIRRDCGL